MVGVLFHVVPYCVQSPVWFVSFVLSLFLFVFFFFPFITVMVVVLVFVLRVDNDVLCLTRDDPVS